MILKAAAVVLSAAMCGDASDQSPFRIADRLDLVPTPQRIELTGDEYATDGWTIVAARSALSQTGAEEINERLTSLGGAAMPVSTTLAAGNLILLAPCTDPLASDFAASAGITITDPGEQGYVIDVVRQDGRTILLAIGCDELGSLYAAMTVRRLIQPIDGRPALLGARVRDWPAFKRRSLGHIGRTFRGRLKRPPETSASDAFVEEFKPYVRWLARHKINATSVSTSRSINVEARREIMEYGRRYGLEYRYIYGTAIEHELEETGGEWTDCVTRKTARHCWTAFDEHKLKAGRIAEFVKDFGYDYVVHHVVDSGGLPNPETWTDRCDRCRERYGDDHPRAAAEQLRLYYDAIKELNPDAKFVAVIQPYHFQWTVDGFQEDPFAFGEHMPHEGHVRGLDDPEKCRQAVERAAALHRAVATALPPDALVTFREAGRREFDGCCRLWAGHPVDIWVYYGRNMAWEGLWEPQVRLTKTWYRDSPGDLLFNAPVGRPSTVNEIYAAGSAEYAWNVNQPDADTNFEIAKRRYEHGGNDVTDYQRESLLPRICRQLWGRSGSAVLPLFANNVSFNYMGQPTFVAASRGENLDDPYEFWSQQTEVLRRAVTEINRAVADVDAGRPSGVYGDLCHEPGYPTFMFLYYYTNLAALKGEIESTVLRAEDLVSEGRTDDATRLVAGLEKRLPAIIQEVEKVKQRIADDPLLPRVPEYRETPPSAKQPLSNELNGYRFEDQRERMAALIPRLLADARLGAVPDHLTEELADRRVEVSPITFNNPFAADGRRGEGGWTGSDPVEFFTVGDGRWLSRFPTRVWVCRDAEALYLLAEMRDADGATPVAKDRERDESLGADDCFGIFISPSETGADYFRLATSAAGTQFDAHGNEPPERWNGEWDVGVAVRSGLWTAEFRIPFTTLGRVPEDGDSWQINMVRYRAPKNRSRRSETSSIIASEDHHAPEEYRKLLFVDRPAKISSRPTIALENVRRRDITVTYGFATQLWLTPEIVSRRQSIDVTIDVAVFDSETPLAERRFTVRTLSGLWKADKEIDLDLGVVVTGDLKIVVTAEALDGTLTAEKSFLLSPSGEIR